MWVVITIVDKILAVLGSSTPDINNIVYISAILYKIFREGVVMPYVFMLPKAHRKIGIRWGKIGSHGSTLDLYIVLIIKNKIVVI